jgi:translocation and assembly module TamB
MSRKTRIVLTTAVVVCGIILGTLGAALYTLQTNWFRQRVRQKIVSAAQQASGGRVELGSFSYDWRTLDAEFDGFVVHGTEPAGAAPLFRARSIRAGFRIVSLLKRDVDIKFLQISHPKINLIVHPDGTTNFPRAAAAETASEFVDQLFGLSVDRFEIDDGWVETNAQKYRLTVRGDNLKLLLTRERKALRYGIAVAVRNVECDAGRWRRIAGDLTANMHLERDRVLVENLTWNARGTRVHASGSVLHFANPVADVNVDGQMAAAELPDLAGMPALQDGQISLSGTVHYDTGARASFAGRASGRKLRFQVNGAGLRDVDFDSAVTTRGGELKLTGFTASGFGGRVMGDALLKDNRELDFTGRFSGLNLRQTAALHNYSLALSGSVNGTLHLTGTLGARNFTVRSMAHVVPSPNGIPLSGNLDISYRQPGGTLTFGDSHLNLPRTELSFSGTASQTLRVTVDSGDLKELDSAFGKDLPLPSIRTGGNVHFDGTVSGLLSKMYVQGNLSATQFDFRNLAWQQLRAHIKAAEGGVDFSALTADSGSLHASGSGHVGLSNWTITPASPVRLQAKFEGADLARVSPGFLPAKLGIFQGTGSGSMNLAGPVNGLRGPVHLHLDNLDAFGQRLNRVQVEADVEGDSVRITEGKMQAGPAVLSFSGTYRRQAGSWDVGQLEVKADSNGFPLASLAAVRNYEPGLQAQMELHAQATAKITAEHVEPVKADGRVTLRGIATHGISYGSLAVGVATRGQLLEARFSGDLRETHVSGAAQVQLTAGLPASGEVHLDRISLATLCALAMPDHKPAPVNGFVKGGFTFRGPLEHLEEMHGEARLDQAEVRSSVPVNGETQERAAELVFRNAGPIVVDAVNGVANIRSLEIEGKDTALSVRGSVAYLPQRPMELSVGGSADLRLLELFDRDMQSSGQSDLAMSVTGTRANPAINGTLRVKNGAFLLKGVPNGLTAVTGLVNFNRDRATLQDLTAQTGGGRVSLTGFVTYGAGGPLVYRLQGNAENVRMRYGGTGSITANADLQLTGTSKNSLFSGTVTVSRVAFNANTDVGTLLASFAAPTPANEQDFLTGLQLDLHLASAPNLQLNTALSRDVEAEIDLRLRGTLSHPVFLGSVSANQGDIKVFGTKYSINRAEVRFTNPVKIEPVLDLDLQTRARGVNVDITIAGTPGKLNVNYRSDPPLQPRDIIALLTVGRAPDAPENVPSTQNNNDVSALQSGANTVLGAAVSPSSSRLQKLFGVANIKIDPMVQGITNTMQRLTIEQQISRDITVTYVTNLSQTSEQIFRLEWALSQQYSVVALRDDNGEFGIDIQYKKRFK